MLWLILARSYGQSGDHCSDSAVQAAAAADWRASAAVSGLPNPSTYDPDQVDYWRRAIELDIVEARFASQQECLHAIRRALPAGQESDDYGQITQTTHARDHVERMQYFYPPPTPVDVTMFACFQEAPRVG